MDGISHPFWVMPSTSFGWRVFNKCLVEPNANTTFPDGAIGIYVDHDFWAVAALPISYADKSIQQIVSELWPELTDCEFGPDSRESDYTSLPSP